MKAEDIEVEVIMGENTPKIFTQAILNIYKIKTLERINL